MGREKAKQEMSSCRRGQCLKPNRHRLPLCRVREKFENVTAAPLRFSYWAAQPNLVPADRQVRQPGGHLSRIADDEQTATTSSTFVLEQHITAPSSSKNGEEDGDGDSDGNGDSSHPHSPPRSSIRSLQPLLDRVLVQRFKAETVSAASSVASAATGAGATGMSKNWWGARRERSVAAPLCARAGNWSACFRGPAHPPGSSRPRTPQRRDEAPRAEVTSSR
jgi:hypothetical protein